MSMLVYFVDDIEQEEGVVMGEEVVGQEVIVVSGAPVDAGVDELVGTGVLSLEDEMVQQEESVRLGEELVGLEQTTHYALDVQALFLVLVQRVEVHTQDHLVIAYLELVLELLDDWQTVLQVAHQVDHQHHTLLSLLTVGQTEQETIHVLRHLHPVTNHYSLLLLCQHFGQLAR